MNEDMNIVFLELQKKLISFPLESENMITIGDTRWNVEMWKVGKRIHISFANYRDNITTSPEHLEYAEKYVTNLVEFVTDKMTEASSSEEAMIHLRESGIHNGGAFLVSIKMVEDVLSPLKFSVFSQYGTVHYFQSNVLISGHLSCSNGYEESVITTIIEVIFQCIKTYTKKFHSKPLEDFLKNLDAIPPNQ